VSTPVSGNLAGKTVVLAQYRQASTASDGHFVDFEVVAALNAWSGFLKSRATTGTATVGP
jgi:hypothetical protein